MSSIFYSENSKGVDVTMPLVKDQEIAPLNMQKQSTVELTDTMKCELKSFSDMIMPISTGTAAINLTVREEKEKHDCVCEREKRYW